MPQVASQFRRGSNKKKYVQEACHEQEACSREARKAELQ